MFSTRRPVAVVFVEQSLSSKAQPMMDLDRDLAYFFHSFLPMNVLTKNNASWQSELQLFLHQSPALSSAVSAIASLHRFQQERLLLNTTGVRKDQVQALNSYSQAVKHVRTAITSNSFAGPALLWSTFFLALFEVRRGERRDRIAIILTPDS